MQDQGQEALQEFREGALMSASNRGSKGLALLACMIFTVAGMAILRFATPASAAIQIESLDFGVTDGGGAPSHQAGAHPDQITTRFSVPTQLNSEGLPLPVEQPRNLSVDLPPGLVGSATAVPTCTGGQLASSTCPDDAAVGYVGLYVEWGDFEYLVPLYNLQAAPGVPAEFGFNLLGILQTHLTAKVHPGPDYRISISTRYIPQGLGINRFTTVFWGVPADHSHDTLRGSCMGFAGPTGATCESTVAEVKPLLTNPTACTPALSAILSVDSWPTPGAFDVASAVNENGSGEPVAIDGCDQPEFEPEIEARPTTDHADSPSGLDAKVHIPQNEEPDGIASAQLKDATFTFPAGMTVNPASAAGLGACSPAQVGLLSPVGQLPARFDGDGVSCPDAAKLGTVRVSTPLVATPLEGAVYLGTQSENPFRSLLALYVVVEDPQTGTIIKLAGHPVADPQSGRLTVSFEQNPQLPFEELELHLFPGSRGALKTPPTCGTFTTTSTMVPWTAPEGETKHPADSFGIVAGAGNSPCPASQAAAPNQPSFAAGTTDPTAGAYSPFVLKVERGDGSQPIAGIETTLPKGLLGRLAGVPYCSDAALAASAINSGRAEQASPSCPPASQVGTVNVGAGAGPTPLYISGKAYLAGPYKGAPLSLAIVTPAVAGPFDLGTVVVRSALEVDPETTRIQVVSDPIPTILQGIPLDIRSIAVNVDRPHFTLNPTGCKPTAVSGTAISIFGQSAQLSTPFGIAGCNALGFKPRLALHLEGRTKRSDYPALTATLRARRGDANLARAVVSLPHSEFLAQNHIGTICTRVRFAAHTCPRRSIYGVATATSPLLGKPLHGPVYLRSSSHELPDLVADLNGQIRVTLAGRIDSENGGIRTSFDLVPDAPITKFVLRMRGGKKGLLENSRNLCNSTSRATVRFNAHNGKIRDFNPIVTDDC
jgi:hypothetical protein